MIFIDGTIAIITQNNFDVFFCRYTSENVETMDIDNIMRELKSFMNESQQLVVLPGKYKKKLIAYYYLATKIEIGQRYTESDIIQYYSRNGFQHIDGRYVLSIQQE